MTVSSPNLPPKDTMEYLGKSQEQDKKNLSTLDIPTQQELWIEIDHR